VPKYSAAEGGLTVVWIRLILVLSLAAMGLSIILGNPSLLPITVLGMQTSPLPLWMLLLGAILFGVLTGTLLQQALDLKPLPFRAVVRRLLSKKQKTRRPQKTAKSKTAKKQNGRSASAPRRPVRLRTDWDEPRPQDWFDRPQKVSAQEYVSRNSLEDDDARPMQRPSAPELDLVVDADYRVLTPPNTVPSPRPRRANDEWDDEFFDDDA
jgi:hypothetical protein